MKSIKFFWRKMAFQTRLNQNNCFSIIGLAPNTSSSPSYSGLTQSCNPMMGTIWFPGSFYSRHVDRSRNYWRPLVLPTYQAKSFPFLFFQNKKVLKKNYVIHYGFYVIYLVFLGTRKTKVDPLYIKPLKLSYTPETVL